MESPAIQTATLSHCSTEEQVKEEPSPILSLRSWLTPSQAPLKNSCLSAVISFWTSSRDNKSFVLSSAVASMSRFQGNHHTPVCPGVLPVCLLAGIVIEKAKYLFCNPIAQEHTVELHDDFYRLYFLSWMSEEFLRNSVWQCAPCFNFLFPNLKGRILVNQEKKYLGARWKIYWVNIVFYITIPWRAMMLLLSSSNTVQSKSKDMQWWRKGFGHLMRLWHTVLH